MRMRFEGAQEHKRDQDAASQPAEKRSAAVILSEAKDPCI